MQRSRKKVDQEGIMNNRIKVSEIFSNSQNKQFELLKTEERLFELENNLREQ